MMAQNWPWSNQVVAKKKRLVVLAGEMQRPLHLNCCQMLHTLLHDESRCAISMEVSVELLIEESLARDPNI